MEPGGELSDPCSLLHLGVFCDSVCFYTCTRGVLLISEALLYRHGGEFCQIFHTAGLQLQLLCLNIYRPESDVNNSLWNECRIHLLIRNRLPLPNSPVQDVADLSPLNVSSHWYWCL